MRLKNYFSLQIVVLGIIANVLIPKTVSSCSPFKANDNNKETGVKVAVVETNEADLKDELLFRY
jgi:hypothetical protein